jgi:acyl carrier protein
MNIEDKIRQFILKNLYFVEDHPLRDDDSFLKEGIIDSMGSMELVAFVEAEFGIKVEMSEVVVRNFDSIRQLAAFVRRKLAAPEARARKSPELSPQTAKTTAPVSTESSPGAWSPQS